MRFSIDDGIYVKNYKKEYGIVDKYVMISLNMYKKTYKDEKGKYVKYADRYDENGNVYFVKKYY